MLRFIMKYANRILYKKPFLFRKTKDRRPRIVVGVTHSQTCLVLKERLIALNKAGFRVTLLSTSGNLLYETAVSAGVEAIALPIERRIAIFRDAFSFFYLLIVLLKIRPHITEFSTPKAGLLGTVAARIVCVPVRVYMLRGLRLQTTHGIKRKLLLYTERLAAWNAHSVLCNSKSLLSEVFLLGIAPLRKLHILGNGSSNGLNLQHFSPGIDLIRPFLKLSEDTFVIGFVGRLTNDKGIPELIQAFEQLIQAQKHICLLLVGWFDLAEDSLRSELVTKIESHPNIRYTGFVKDASPYYRAMDVMVLPTWREGFPNVALEAAATEVPVITTTATGARDAVIPGVTGLCVPPGNSNAIVKAVIELMQNADRRRQMGKAARAWVEKKFTNEQVLGMTCRYYVDLLKQRCPQKQVAVDDYCITEGLNVCAAD